MKENLDFLPQEKQIQLGKIVKIINEISHFEMIILFGSYARNQWVEDKYDEVHYRYQSDFDILGIVETKSDAAQNRLQWEIKDKIAQMKQLAPLFRSLFMIFTL